MNEMNDNEETKSGETVENSRLAFAPCSALVFDILESTEQWSVEGLPFDSGKGRKSGVYAFFAYNGPSEVCLYVGKAFCLRSRLQQHMHHSEWVNRFFDDLGDPIDDPPGLLLPMFARVWFSDNRAGLETIIMRSLRPRYNKRNEG